MPYDASPAAFDSWPSDTAAGYPAPEEHAETCPCPDCREYREPVRIDILHDGAPLFSSVAQISLF